MSEPRALRVLAVFTFALAGVDVALAGLSACTVKVDTSKLSQNVQGDGAPPAIRMCNVDADCATSIGCASGSCDTATHTCAYSFCGTPLATSGTACHASSCTYATGRCSGAPQGYGFHAGAVPLQFQIACSSCMVAMHPYVFIRTPNQVVVVNVADPTDMAPPQFVLEGISFTPRALLASGRRVYFVGRDEGVAQPSRVPVAWVDVPNDPTLTTFAVENAAFAYPTYGEAENVFSGQGDVLYFQRPRDNMSVYGDILLVHTDERDQSVSNFLASQGFPGNGATFIAASGSRLMTRRLDAARIVNFSLETSPGTASSQIAGPEVPAGGIGPIIYDAVSYSPNPRDVPNAGAVAWAGVTGIVPESGSTNIYQGVKAGFLVADGMTTAIDTGSFVAVQDYTNQMGGGVMSNQQGVLGGIALSDESHAIVLASAHENLSQTNVGVITKGDTNLGAQKYTLVPRADSPFALSGSNGFAYVVTQDSPSAATLHIFAPACGP